MCGILILGLSTWSALDAVSLGLVYIVYVFSAYLLKMLVAVLTVMFSSPI